MKERIKKMSCMIIALLFAGNAMSQSADQYIEKALQGDSESMFLLAHCYNWGLGVTKDRTKYLDWLVKAALKEYPAALSDMAELYVTEDSEVGMDSIRAFNLYKKAASQKDLKAMSALGLEFRNFLKAEEAVNILKQISNDDFIYYDRKWPEMFGDTDFVIDIDKSCAEHELFLLYQGCEGVKRDIPLSIYYLKRSVNHGEFTSTEAINSMGECYLEGNGVQKDKEEAIRWFKKKNSGLALGNLGVIYYNDGNYEEAFRHLKEACDDDMWPSPKAMHHLAACYKYGRGTSVDKKQAEYWENEAVKHGDLDATELLKLIKKNRKM
ncbi:MAG: sel1 repeat family protein [Prevotella sp.]|nr:sel1 repeat family protein [Prevotella sp.]